MQTELSIGYVTGSHGVRGELKVYSTSGEIEHFHKLKNVVLVSPDGGQERQYQVTSVRGKPQAVIMAVQGIENPEDAKALRGWVIKVPRKFAASLQKNEYYVGDLVGCRLVYENGTAVEQIGEITGVWDNGAVNMFDVSLTDGRQCVVPFQDQFIGRVDIKAGEIQLRVKWIIE